MENQAALDYDQARLLDLLHQVKEVDKMIELYNSPPVDLFMISQYRHQKNKFLVELKEVFWRFGIDVNINVQEKAP